MLHSAFFRQAPRPRPMNEMHYLDSAVMLAHLHMAGNNLADLSQRTGMPPQQVVDRMRLLELDEGLRCMLRQAGMPERTAMLLLRLPDALTRRRLAQRMIRERLCIRDAALLVEAAKKRRPVQAPASGQHVIKVIRDIRPFRNAIRDIAGQMNAAGVRATFTERRTGGMQELTVAYPARKRRTERYQSM